MEHVGVTGHSFGAETALLIGGARLNTDMFMDEWCALSPDDMLNDCATVPVLLDQMAEMAGLEAVPEGLWPDWSNARVDAIISLAPGAHYFGPEGLAALHVPVLLVESELDWYAGDATAYYQPYTQLPAGLKTHVVFDRGDHGVFLNECKAMPALIGMGFSWFCQDAVWDVNRAHDLINHFATAFVLAELKGDAAAAAALAPEGVSFPGITYESDRYASEQAITPELIAEIEAFVAQEMEARQIPGAALGIVKDGALAYAKGFGVSELGGDDPVTPDSNFLVSSVSKSFTGVGIMQLVEEGKIDLDAPVTEYLPYFTLAEPESRQMTIRQLLSHTSGMPDVGDIDAEFLSPDTPTGEGALDEYIRSYNDDSLLFQPGEEWAYSTVGIDVLGDVIAKVSGQSFEEYMNGNVLGPIGMEDSTFLLGEVDPDKLVTPHHLGTEGATTVEYIQWLRVHGPGSGLFTTVNDMARFAIVNMNHGEIDGTQVLPATAYEEMWAPQAASTWVDWLGPRFNHYGLGWWVGEDGGYQAIGNYGAVEGFNAHLEILPEKNIAVIFLGNFMDFGQLTFNSNEIGSAIAVMLANAESEASTTPALDAELIAEIEALVEQVMEDLQIPGVSVGIVKDGDVAYARGFGVAEYGSDRAMTPQTQFAVACITKGFTTSAIMQLVEQGLIDLNAPVTDYLPYFKLADQRYKDITIHHLLANTAGLPMPNYFAVYGGFSENPVWSPDLLEEYVRSLANRSMEVDPADNIFMYGGDYFDILGDVIVKVSGQPFEEYMEEHILAPLGLEHTTFIVDELDPELATACHWQDENGNMQFATPSPSYFPAHTPSNGMFSNTEDLLKWAIFNLNRGELDGEQIVPAFAFEGMWTPRTEIPWGGIYQHWGYGWGISDVEDHRLVFWGGGHIGSPNAYYLVPEENLGLHVAVNRSLEAVKGNEYADAIAFPALKILLGMDAEEVASQ